EQAIVFTMSYARANGIWPRQEALPEGPVPPAPPGPESGPDRGPRPPEPAPIGALTAEGVLREALARLWEQARSKKIQRLSAVRIRMFDASDAFRLIGAAAPIPGAQKSVRIDASYETTDDATFSCEFGGPLTEALPVKDFLDAQLRAAKEKQLEAELTLRFDGGLDMNGDAAEKLAERLTRQAIGAAYVTATAEVEVLA
ncbi:MAG: ATP-binding protein, partial [Longimicrobiales bacterium]